MHRATVSPDRGSSPAADSLEKLSHLSGQHFASSNDATRAVLETISDILGMRTSWVSHAHMNDDTLEIVASHNKPGGCDVAADSVAPLPETFCSVAIRSTTSAPLVIEDVRRDPSFSDSAAARAFPNIGAYIGVPIVLSNGDVYGTLCASDPEPHPISHEQGELLTVLSRMLATQIERDAEIEQRKATEGLFNAFMNNGPVIAYLKDASGRYLYVNQPFERTFGVERDWLIGRTDHEWLDPVTAASVHAHDVEVLATGVVRQFVEPVLQSDGSSRYFYSYKFPLADAEGRKMLGGASADITDRRERELERAHLAAIVSDSADAIYARSLDGVVTSWNPSAERLFGFEAAEMLGESLDKLVPSTIANDQPHISERLAAGERIVDYETTRQTKTGRLLTVALTVSPIRDSEGDVVGASTIARDITEHRRLIAERDRLYDELQAEVSRAAIVQAHLLPRVVPHLPGFEFVATCLPAREVGGDFFDWAGTQDLVRITLGDVSGKGMAASLLMATARAALRTAQDKPVAESINTVNRVLYPDLEQSDSFITMFHLDMSADGRLSYVDAGHGLALILRRDGTVESLKCVQPPLGILEDVSYDAQTARLEEGDLLMIYSDGLVDTRPDLALEHPANAGALCLPADNAQRVLERLVEASSVAVRPDDLTIILVRRQELAA